MSNEYHKNLTGTDNHVIHSWTYSDSTTRIAATGFIASDLGKVSLQSDNNTLWLLITTTPTWKELTNTGIGTDEFVKVSANDTTIGYLNGKLVAGTNITLTENNDGGNETLIIEAEETDAIHDNVPGEINAITEKSTPINNDWLLIEDSAASNAKKKVKIGNLPGTGGGGLGLFEYASSEEESCTNNTSFQSKISKTTSASLSSGKTYKFTWSCEVSNVAKDYSTEIRFQVNTTIYNKSRSDRLTEDGDYAPLAGSVVLTGLNGTTTFDLFYRAVGETAKIRRARIDIQEVI